MAKAAKQVTVDEAVVAKGGQPSSDFKTQYEDAAGITAANEASERAAKLFAVPAPELPAEVLPLKLADLFPSPRNPRSSLDDLEELTKSIRVSGVLTPLLVRERADGGWEIISGHRRHAAARLAELDSVPCSVLDVGEVQALETNLTEQLQRKQLTPLEEGEACRELQELSGYSVDQVATKLGQSPSWVRRRLKLCTLAPEAKKALREGKLPYGAAVDLALLPTHKLQADALAHFFKYERDEAPTAGNVIDFLQREFAKPLKSAPFDTKSETLVPEAGACTKCPKNSSCGPAGLFDNFDPRHATCSDVKCFEDKARATFDLRTAKAREEGAEVLPKTEAAKLFQYGDSLAYGSKFVDAARSPYEDGKNRTWGQIAKAIPEKNRPQLVLAQDPSGALHELYDEKALRAAAQKHAGLKKSSSSSGSSYDVQAKAEAKKRRHREAVVGEILEAVVSAVAAKGGGLDLADLRALARAEDTAGELHEGISRALGLADKKANDVEKWIDTKANAEQLQAFIFGQALLRACSGVWKGIDEDLVEVAKRYDLDPAKMLKARLDAEKAEEALKAAKKKKGGKS